MEDTEQPINSKKKSRIKGEWVVALAAVAVSILTMFVYIYQARIMMEQQHMSVWPYLEWTMTISTEEGFYLSVQNKGVGPAIVKASELTLDGKSMQPRELMTALFGAKTDSLWIFYDTVDGRVIAPGEGIRLYHMQNKSDVSLPETGRLFDRIKYKICYCNVYGDCWTSHGLEVVEGDCK
jgi:hypothetical protein